MPKPVKVEAVKEIEEKLKNSPMAVLVNNKGLTVPAVTELRKKLRDAGVDYKVYKNTLFLRAATGLKYAGLEDVLKGPTAIAFSPEPIAPAKIIMSFIKDNPALEVKGAVYESKFIGPEEIRKFSTYLSRTEVLTQLVCLLNTPLSGFVRVVDAVRAQKETAK